MVSRCRDTTATPLWVKLSPNVADVGAIARAAEEAGADALVLINTLRGLAIDRATGRPLLGGPGGGLSGPAIKPVALSCIHACRAVSTLPIVGMGGIAGGDDAWEFLAAGASAVAVGTALFASPVLPAGPATSCARFWPASGPAKPDLPRERAKRRFGQLVNLRSRLSLQDRNHPQTAHFSLAARR